MVKRILSSDILIADQMVPLPYHNKEELERIEDPIQRDKYRKLDHMIDELLQRQNVKRGQKARLTAAEFADFSAAISGLTGSIEPGGSSANTLTTLKKLVGDHVDLDFLGVVGADKDSHIIRKGLADANIHVLPKEFPSGQVPQSAVSFVFTEPGGGRTIATYPGNAKDLLKSHMVGEDMINNNDIVFVQGSLWEKFDKSFPDRLCELRWNKNKEIWLALPTHAKFSDDMPPDKYRFLIPSADVVMGNSEELMRIYETNDLKHALERLRSDLSRRDQIIAGEHKPPREKDAIAFITCGEQGAVVVTKDGRIDIPPPDVSKIPKLYTLGAGDTAYAGFLAGHLAGLAPKASATLAMELAGEKLKYNSARIPDPHGAMLNGPLKGKMLMQDVDKKLADIAAGVDIPHVAVG